MNEYQESILQAAETYRSARWRVQAALNRLTDIGEGLDTIQRNKLASYQRASEDFNEAKQAEQVAQIGLLMTISPMGSER